MRTLWLSLVARRLPLTATGAVLAALALAIVASASHPEASLSGSNFEIDTDANLKLDDPAPSIDWASVPQGTTPGTEARRSDAPTGRNDDSYSGGAKEDDTCPGTPTGSIPTNKSDLLTFGAYVEPEVGGAGFLNLFWQRVQEPNGTTLMDFELNKSQTDCGNGVNPVRTVGDLLIEYRLEQGGAMATIKVREWTGSAWGPANDLTSVGAATGTINSSAIPASDSDGLSSTNPISPRTFGEAQLDLDFILDEGSCESFGSAFLKSRASDAFNSQMKDFIAPVPVSITNCGKVIIRKQTNPEENPNTTEFGYTKSFSTDPSGANTFTLMDDGVKTFENVLFGTGYTVTEDVIPSGWDLQSLDCSASTGVTPSVNSATVTFDIDNAADVLDCTYTNRKLEGAILITKTRKHAAAGSGDHPHAGVDFTITGGSLPAGGTTVTTNGDGEACLGGLVLSSFVGDYTVDEDTPEGYTGEADKTVTVDNEASCADDPYGGESVSFHNTPLTDITVSVDSQVDGGTASTIDCEPPVGNPPDPTATNANGDGSLTLSDKEPGTYECTIFVDP
ncbi:MAG: hypothetical protein ABI726_02100 [bacterium]